MTKAQETQLLELLWESMKRDKEHRDRVKTGWGTKTKEGLIACINTILAPPKLDYDHAECQDCGKIWPVSELRAVSDIHDRVAAEEPMPAGVCPDDECRALCHLVEVAQ